MTNSQWQPIETAPKDGTWVLLTGGHSGIETDPIYCGPCVTAFWMDHEWDQGWVYAYWDGGWGSGYEEPTHWMPLPEPPGTYKTSSDGLLAALNAMTDEQRLEVFFNYCQHCGSKDRGCQCMNDE